MDDWAVHECGYSFEMFRRSGRRKSGTMVQKEVFRRVMDFSSKPVELVVSSVWDGRHIYAKCESPGGPIVKESYSGRWSRLDVAKMFGSVLYLVEVGSHIVVVRTARGRVFIMDAVTKEVSSLSVSLDSLHAVQGTGKVYAALDGGCVYECKLKDCVLELCSPLLAGVQIRQVACGSDHVLLLGRGSGRVWSKGLNHRGQLGHDDLVARVEPEVVEALDGVRCDSLTCGLWHSLVLSHFGDVYSWGWNADGQLGHSAAMATVALPGLVGVDEEITFQAVSCGSRHSAALTVSGQLWTWGWNGYGQLGHLGASSSNPAPVHLPGTGGRVTWVHCEPWSTLMLIHTEEETGSDKCDL